MGKTKRLKVDYDDTAEILELVQILKDIASNLFYHSAKSKQILIDFMAYFIDFFKMANFTNANHILVNPTSEAVGILVITSESAFMGDMNGRMVRHALAEAEKENSDDFVVIGQKAGDKLKFQVPRSKHVEVFGQVQERGLYKTSIAAKDYIIENVMNGKLGRIVAVYPFAFNINLIKPKSAVLFPSSDVLLQHMDQTEDTIEKVIVDSDLNEIIGYLSSVWLTCRIYELLMNCQLSGYAAQVQQLEAAEDRLKKEKAILGIMLRKSRKADISKGISETFSAGMVRAGGPATKK